MYLALCAALEKYSVPKGRTDPPKQEQFLNSSISCWGEGRALETI